MHRPVPAAIKPEEQVKLVADYTKIAPVQVAINGIMVRALILVLILIYGMVQAVYVVVLMNLAVVVLTKNQ